MSAGARADWSALRPGTELYARGEMRAAHEAWEDAWRAQPGTLVGQVARALAQLGAAGVHLEAGRAAGFRSVGAKCAQGLHELAEEAEPDAGANLGELSRRIAGWAAHHDPTLDARPPAELIPS